MSLRPARPDGEVFAAIADIVNSDVWQNDRYPDHITYHLYTSPPLCPQYPSYSSQWGVVISKTPIERGSVIIFKVLNSKRELFEVVED